MKNDDLRDAKDDYKERLYAEQDVRRTFEACLNMRHMFEVIGAREKSSFGSHGAQVSQLFEDPRVKNVIRSNLPHGMSLDQVLDEGAKAYSYLSKRVHQDAPKYNPSCILVTKEACKSRAMYVAIVSAFEALQKEDERFRFVNGRGDEELGLPGCF
ncbi:hypothetical protein HK104_005400 [Borealophlyctis nickersoniae]|nr:hypothetical protein HK104_005400 [Borealophlyctis nickersoniae]